MTPPLNSHRLERNCPHPVNTGLALSSSPRASRQHHSSAQYLWRTVPSQWPVISESHSGDYTVWWGNSISWPGRWVHTGKVWAQLREAVWGATSWRLLSIAGGAPELDQKVTEQLANIWENRSCRSFIAHFQFHISRYIISKIKEKTQLRHMPFSMSHSCWYQKYWVILIFKGLRDNWQNV